MSSRLPLPKALVILGPTASGKTALSLRLAKALDGQIVSADSRQLYQGLDLLTGKGLAEDADFKDQSHLFEVDSGKKIGTYSLNHVPIWLYDVVSPIQSLNTAEYFQLAWQVIQYIWKQGQLPIIAGGTGFYIKNLFSPPPTMGIPVNQNLRNQLEQKTVSQLQQLLLKYDQEKLYSMNSSDKANPRRLVRAIEVSCHSNGHAPVVPPNDPLIIGLMPDKEKMHQRILKNIQQRAGDRLTQELEWFSHLPGFSWQLPAASSTGSWWWYQYLQQKITREEAVARWYIQEKQYAKRQLVYFQKMAAIHWFNPDSPEFEKAVVALVKSWYANTNE